MEFALYVTNFDTLWYTFFVTYSGAHRLWSHKSYKARWPLRTLLAVLFTGTGQRTIFKWARDHRLHHKFRLVFPELADFIVNLTTITDISDIFLVKLTPTRTMQVVVYSSLTSDGFSVMSTRQWPPPKPNLTSATCTPIAWSCYTKSTIGHCTRSLCGLVQLYCPFGLRRKSHGSTPSAWPVSDSSTCYTWRSSSTRWHICTVIVRTITVSIRVRFDHWHHWPWWASFTTITIIRSLTTTVRVSSVGSVVNGICRRLSLNLWKKLDGHTIWNQHQLMSLSHERNELDTN